MDFNNTKVAFSGMSNKDLKRSYWLFKIIGWNWLIKISPTLLKIFMPLWFPIPIIRATIFKQFCGGESIEDCEETIQKLSDHNIKTILDYSVEGIEGENTFDNNVNEALKAINTAKVNQNIPFTVFKVTGFARFSLLEKINKKKSLTPSEQEEYNRVLKRIDTMCEASYDSKIPVFIDAEETWIQDAIDDIAFSMMKKYNTKTAIVYNTAQLYRWDRLDYIKGLHEKAMSDGFIVGLKLVRGAYIEKERERAKEMGYKDPMQKTKDDTDKDFNLSLKYCIENINEISICCGSHNEESTLYLINLMKEHNIANDNTKVYFAQLLGMSDHISKNIAIKNYNTAKYVPYGPVKDVTPYLIRRAQENTSVQGQTGRELSLILKEQKRRKAS